MQAMATHEPEMIYAKDAAKRYGIPYETVRSWIRLGKVGHQKLGRGRILVSRTDMERMTRPRSQ